MRSLILAAAFSALAAASAAFPVLAPLPAVAVGECSTDWDCESRFGAGDWFETDGGAAGAPLSALPPARSE